MTCRWSAIASSSRPWTVRGLPSIAKGFGPVGPQGEGPPDQIHRHIRPPTLEVEGTQEFKSLGLTRLPIQNLAIDPLGLRQPPGLVVPDRCLHCLPDRHRLSSALVKHCTFLDFLHLIR